MSDPVLVEKLDNGAYWRIVLGGSKGNILDARVMAALSSVLADAAADAHVKALCLEGQGAHFSFGASVAEHLPDSVGAMLTQFHGLLLGLVDASVIVLAAVRGQCLGGAMELVTLCHRVFASKDAKFGQPEIVLGVFAPAASVLLAERVGRGAAEDLCLSGRSITAEEAYRIGLVDQIAETDPAEAAHEYAQAHLLPRSASSLRLAAKAVRVGLRARLAAELPEVERIYLKELMATHDAVEGLRAFVEKRAATWQDQ
ncbi:MAG: cyclohexa-1,5-dienecarbonyl-CoA hydratase [Acidobacteria bacterium]|nr:cyclohexa-1,5-dienecarbonyl-CoA hydratase [Acidobacteriota bacterium]